MRLGDGGKLVAYLQNLNTMVSNTSTGPVEPITVSGWPANMWYVMPHIAPLTRLSIAACVHTSQSQHTELYSPIGVNAHQTLGVPPFLIPQFFHSPLTQLEGLGSAVSSPSGYGRSPATKRILVHLQVKMKLSDDRFLVFLTDRTKRYCYRLCSTTALTMKSIMLLYWRK